MFAFKHFLYLFLITECACKKVFNSYKEFRSIANNYNLISATWTKTDQFLHQVNDTLYLHDVKEHTDQLFYKHPLLAQAYQVQYQEVGFFSFIIVATEKISGFTHYMDTYTYTVIDQVQDQIIWQDSGIQKFVLSGSDPAVENLGLFAFVKNFNVHLFTCSGNNFVCDKESVQTIPLTFNGDKFKMFNGITDWMYAVEITDDDALVWFNDDNTALAYGRIDMEGVSFFEYQVYGQTPQASNHYDGIYPKMISFPYPAPGTKLPKTVIQFVDIEKALNGHYNEQNAYETTLIPTTEVQAWDSTNEEEDLYKGYYLNIARWVDSATFEAQWKNRNENQAITERCSVAGVCTSQSVLKQANTQGWVGNYRPSWSMGVGRVKILVIFCV